MQFLKNKAIICMNIDVIHWLYRGIAILLKRWIEKNKLKKKRVKIYYIENKRWDSFHNKKKMFAINIIRKTSKREREELGF